MSKLPDSTETANTLRDLREQIKARRSRLSGFDPAGTGGSSNAGLSALRQSVDEVNDLWFVSAHLPITWSVPGVGTAVAYLKRGARVLLRWYINPIVEQQNRFNSAVARSFVELTAYQERLTREWELLDERVRLLEEQAGVSDEAQE